MQYKIGSLTFVYDESRRKGIVCDNGMQIQSGDNAVILYGRFISEVDRKLREHMRATLDEAGIDQWTGKPKKNKQN